METTDVLMLEGAAGWCPDCAAECILLPLDRDGLELCCTACDAAFSTWVGLAADPAPAQALAV